MKRQRWFLLGLAAAFAVLAVSDATASGQTADELHIAAGYAAKESCSCAFTEGQTDAICVAYGASPTGTGVKVTIDHTANTVTATLLGISRVASFTAGAGCTLETY